MHNSATYENKISPNQSLWGNRSLIQANMSCLYEFHLNGGWSKNMSMSVFIPAL